MKSLLLLAATAAATPASAFSIVSLHSGPATIMTSTADLALIAAGVLAISGVVALRLARRSLAGK